MPLTTQIPAVVKRTFVAYWRTPNYILGKMILHIFTGLFNCFTFYRLGNSSIDMQSRLFSTPLCVAAHDYRALSWLASIATYYPRPLVVVSAASMLRCSTCKLVVLAYHNCVYLLYALGRSNLSLP